MKCPKCSNLDCDRVLESRESPGGDTIRRRRECTTCKGRYTTYERIERPALLVIKKDGSQEVFDRHKLLEGLSRAIGKFYSGKASIENLVGLIEDRAIEQSEDNAISSTAIGNLVLEELLTTNEVAYIRFVSVYHNFKSLEEYVNELQNIKENQLKKRKN